MAVTSAAVQAENAAALNAARAQLSAVLFAVYGPGNEEALEDVGVLAVNAVKEELSKPGAGRTYSSRGAGRPPHTASAPGDPPAVDTGRLRSSYTHEVGRDGLGPFVDVGTPTEYAPPLEFGTSRMAARPHLRTAFEKVRDRLRSTIADAITKRQAAAIGSLGGVGRAARGK